MRYVKNKDLLAIITIYIFITIILMINRYQLYANIINPLFWLFILAYMIFNLKKNYVRFPTNKRYFIYMIVISCIHVLFFFYLGFIFGFFKSPYSHTILSILKNIIIQILPIVSIEIARGIIATNNKNNKIVLVFLTTLLILVECNYNKLINLFPQKEQFFKYICESVLPLIACNILYTYLTLKGSYKLPLVYRFFNRFITLVLPILPNINWFANGALCILSPTIIYLLFKYQFAKEREDIRKKQKNTFEKISYAVALIISITLICFMLGVFRYEPITILSNSMYPTFSRGDVIIFEKLNDIQLGTINEDNIIIYTIGDKNIAHRIVNKIIENGDVSYQTKGDYNNAPDINLVKIEQIKGVYVFHIKYIGFPSIWLYEFLNNKNTKI